MSKRRLIARWASGTLSRNCEEPRGLQRRSAPVAAWLLRVTEACETVTDNPRLSAVTTISQARLLATAIHLREDITPKQRQQLLNRWEKVSFRIYGLLKKDARTRVGDYVRLAWRVIKERTRT